MKYRLLSCTLGCVLAAATLPSCQTNPATVFPGEAWKTATPESQGIDSAKLNAAMDCVKEICGKDGNSQCVVIRNGYMIWQGSDIDNRHLIWSCTKSFNSTCLGLLWDDGKCTPQTLAKDFFPAMAKDYPTVTLEHFATFTSGYDGKKDAFTPGPPMYAPGAAFHYSRQADTLAYVLTQIAQEPISQLFKRRIGQPIGITDEMMKWGSYGKIGKYEINGGAGSPQGGVHINARGMARFGWLYANGGNWDGKQLISKRYIEYASHPRVSNKVPPYDPKAWYVNLPGNYGLNWWVSGVKPNGTKMWPHAPKDTFAAQGNKNNICFIVPRWKMVIVRLGMDKIINTDQFDRVFELIQEGMTK